MPNLLTRPKSQRTRVVMPTLVIAMGLLLIGEGLALGQWLGVPAGCALLALGGFGLRKYRHEKRSGRWAARDRSTPSPSLDPD